MTAFKGITVRDFIKIREVAEEHKANPPRQLIHVMAIVLKKSTDEIGQMPYGDVKKLAKDNDWAFGYPDEPIKKKFRFKGRRFKAILDANKIKAGQFIDATELSKGDGT